MREFSFPLDDSLKVGLMAADKMRRNEPGLLECFNLRSTKEGLQEYTPIVDPFGASASWPYPQFFDTKDGTYAATLNAIWEVDSGLNLVLKGGSLTGGDLWSMADFYTYQVWVNGNGCSVLDPTTGVLSGVSLSHVIESICNFNGQLVAGGFGGSKSNWVAWSGIGKVYLTELLDKEDQSNVTGQMPIGWFGDVYTVKQLGKVVMVYGSGGVTAMIPISSPVVGFGLKQILPHGIASKGCVGGDEHQHIFIDGTGVVHSLSEDLSYKRLGYKNFITNLSAADIIISFDTIERDFYICDGSRTYLLADGLSEVYQLPTGLSRIGGILYGTLVADGTPNTSAYITTNSFDCSLRAIKTISVLEVGCSSEAIHGAVDYNYRSGEAFTRSTLKDASKYGVVSPIVSGTDFRAHVVATSHVGFEVDSLTVRWKLSDKRAIRGAYGDQRNL